MDEEKSGDPATTRLDRAAILAAVIVLVVAALGGDGVPAAARWLGGLQDGMHRTGAPLPGPIADEPLRDKVALLATTGTYPWVFGGVLVQAAIGASDVRASSIRDGGIYWTYRRHSLALNAVSRDETNGDLYLTWRDRDDKHIRAVDRVDVAAGKVVWHHDAGADIDRLGKREDNLIVAAHPVGSPAAVALSFSLATGLDEATGRRRWAVPQPKDCSLIADPRTIAGASGLVAVVQQCVEKNQSRLFLLGLDTATGASRWRTPLPSREWSEPPDYVEPIPGGRLLVGGRLDPWLAVDATTGRPSKKGLRPLAHWVRNGDARNGPAVAQCALAKWCGYDIATGRRIWTQTAPPGFQTDGRNPVISHGRVYALTEEDTLGIEPGRQINVLDQKTGAWITRLPLPSPPGDQPGSTPSIPQIRDGVFIVGYPSVYSLLGKKS
ncbi:PQQ-binding-like beta-propeller repeat protein [Actinomadura xylanilytica]|uniref:outer membrane protein assembly factor BamB family protein n=1 Tax=Actinomadura xylanilytica TaxID=887459 RepID=UPI00255B3639|nr:PQQ-binding-like beta-propeller repeat protein [Actinomadura xylanilytica]MDL4775209.1 PQQ-binding-like beta-propeller repeat protein [Actinomadura xylanilytica]